MYSDAELDAAVGEGVLTAQAASAGCACAK